jgi:serine/threonine protein kinase
MPLASGAQLGHYKIQSLIGTGGMGEVYRAVDSKLEREVAIKVLPAALADDPERLARFEREAKVLAQLNHPGIAAIHGVEDRALVMELVPGPTLADRIKQGPIPPGEAEEILLQIADALEYAHERGVIHRDLKPANIKIDPDDKVKILDFGLAKALTDPGSSIAGDPTNSPTVTMGGTVLGTILGTAAYMAPEQARGKKVDKRADIWAFGVVAWEMLAGERLFKGEDTVQVLSRVLEQPVDLERFRLGSGRCWSGVWIGIRRIGCGISERRGSYYLNPKAGLRVPRRLRACPTRRPCYRGRLQRRPRLRRRGRAMSRSATASKRRHASPNSPCSCLKEANTLEDPSSLARPPSHRTAATSRSSPMLIERPDCGFATSILPPRACSREPKALLARFGSRIAAISALARTANSRRSMSPEARR